MGMNAPYRETIERSKDGSWSVGPIYPNDKHGHGKGIRCLERKFTQDGWVTWEVGIWNGQRDGEPTVAVKMGLVATRDQWNAYKNAVDELWEAWEKDEAP